MELLDDLLRRHTDGADKQLRLFLNDDVDQLVKLALGVVVVGLSSIRSKRGNEQIDSES